MPLTKANTNNVIRGRIVPNANQRRDCQAVVAQLNFADYGRGAGTLHTVGAARLDMQGRTATGVNIQVQIGASTAGAALIDDTVIATTDPINRIGAANAGISALNQSMDSGHVWSVIGTLP